MSYVGEVSKMPIDPKMGFQIGSAGINLASALFGGSSGSEQTYQQGAAAFGAAQQMQQNSLNLQGSLYDQQIQATMADAAEAARVKAREVRQFAEQQALTYSGNGVLLAGTPMKVVNDTRREGRLEVDYIMRSAAAQANLLRTQKMITMNQGMASMLGAQMQFTAQRAQAAMAASANKAGTLQSALSQLGGLFSTTGGGAAKPLTTPKQPTTPPPTPPKPPGGTSVPNYFINPFQFYNRGI